MLQKTKKVITLKGFLQKKKFFNKKLAFLDLRLIIGPTFLKEVQITVKDAAAIKRFKALPLESFICISVKPELSGKLRANSKKSYIFKQIKTINESETRLLKGKDPDKLIQELAQSKKDLDLKILLFKSRVYQSLRDFLLKKKFTQFISKKLITEKSEGGCEVFKVISLDQKKNFFLAQSPQLYKQSLINKGFNRVYELGPIYRAEQFKTTRHLNEALCLDVEYQTNSIGSIMNLLRELLLELQKIPKADLEGLSFLTYSGSDFAKIKYSKASFFLKKKGLALDGAGERFLLKVLKKKFLFITDYPTGLRPFYTKSSGLNELDLEELSESFDLIGAKGELCSGGLRINNYSKLIESIKKNKLDFKEKSYLQSFLLGVPQTGGFGLGIDRLIVLLLDLKSVHQINC